MRRLLGLGIFLLATTGQLHAQGIQLRFAWKPGITQRFVLEQEDSLDGGLPMRQATAIQVRTLANSSDSARLEWMVGQGRKFEKTYTSAATSVQVSQSPANIFPFGAIQLPAKVVKKGDTWTTSGIFTGMDPAKLAWTFVDESTLGRTKVYKLTVKTRTQNRKGFLEGSGQLLLGSGGEIQSWQWQEAVSLFTSRDAYAANNNTRRLHLRRA